MAADVKGRLQEIIDSYLEKDGGMVLNCTKGFVNLYIKNNLLTTVNRTRIETKSLNQLVNLMRKHIDYTPEKPRTIKDILRDEA